MTSRQAGHFFFEPRGYDEVNQATDEFKDEVTIGYNIRRIDLMMMGLVMAVTVIGLKLVGLILIVALLIIPAVTARFWTQRASRLIWIAGTIGGLAAYAGAAISASAPDLPTGPIIVLIAAGLFTLSLFFAPTRGVIATFLRHRLARMENA